jgi:hypothetical protein
MSPGVRDLTGDTLANPSQCGFPRLFWGGNGFVTGWISRLGVDDESSRWSVGFSLAFENVTFSHRCVEKATEGPRSVSR